MASQNNSEKNIFVEPRKRLIDWVRNQLVGPPDQPEIEASHISLACCQRNASPAGRSTQFRQREKVLIPLATMEAKMTLCPMQQVKQKKSQRLFGATYRHHHLGSRSS